MKGFSQSGHPEEKLGQFKFKGPLLIKFMVIKLAKSSNTLKPQQWHQQIIWTS